MRSSTTWVCREAAQTLAEKTWEKKGVKSGDEAPLATRYAHKATLLDSKMYIFGGYGEGQGWLNDLCCVDLAQLNVSFIFQQ